MNSDYDSDGYEDYEEGNYIPPPQGGAPPLPPYEDSDDDDGYHTQGEGLRKHFKKWKKTYATLGTALLTHALSKAQNKEVEHLPLSYDIQNPLFIGGGLGSFMKKHTPSYKKILAYMLTYGILAHIRGDGQIIIDDVVSPSHNTTRMSHRQILPSGGSRQLTHSQFGNGIAPLNTFCGGMLNHSFIVLLNILFLHSIPPIVKVINI